MEQEYGTHQRDNNKFLDQFFLQGIDGTVNQAGTVIGRNNLDPVRQTGLKGLELFLYAFDGRQRIFTPAHDDHATDDFTLAIQLGDTPAHLRTKADIRNIFE